MTLEFLEEAEQELIEAALWYESKEPGLGRRLWDEVAHVVSRIAEDRCCGDSEKAATAKSTVPYSQCAVKGVLFPVGANPTRQLSLQPEAPGAVQGGNELD